MKRYWPLTLVVLGSILVVPGVGLASPKPAGPGMSPSGKIGSSKFITPKVIDFKVIDPKVTKVTKLITPKVIDLKVIDLKVTKVVIDPKVTKLVIDPKVTKIIIDPKFTKLVVDPKKTFVINPKVTKIIVGHSCHCAHSCWPVCCPIVCWHPCLWGFWTVPVQDERYLRLHNDTPEVVTFYLRFHTHDFTGEWEWIPEPPVPTAEKWLAFKLAPGEVLDTRFMDVPIAANRIRLWAQSATRTWETYKDDDLWLVPEVLPSGEHLYYSEFRQTFTFRLTPR